MVWFLLLLCLKFLPAEAQLNRARLRSDLLKNYDKSERPGPNYTETFDVVVILFPNYLKDLDEETSRLELDLGAFMEWKDPRLIWNLQSYDNISGLLMDFSEIWTPKVDILRRFTRKMLIRTIGIWTGHKGNVAWLFEMKLSFFCPLDIYTDFPHDRHRCFTSFYAWSEGGMDICMRHQNFPYVGFRDNHPKWKLYNFTYHTERKEYHGKEISWKVLYFYIVRKGSRLADAARVPAVGSLLLTVGVVATPTFMGGVKLWAGSLAFLLLTGGQLLSAQTPGAIPAHFAWLAGTLSPVWNTILSALVLESAVLYLSRLQIALPAFLAQVMTSTPARAIECYLPLVLSPAHIAQNPPSWPALVALLDRLLLSIYVIVATVQIALIYS